MRDIKQIQTVLLRLQQDQRCTQLHKKHVRASGQGKLMLCHHACNASPTTPKTQLEADLTICFADMCYVYEVDSSSNMFVLGIEIYD